MINFHFSARAKVARHCCNAFAFRPTTKYVFPSKRLQTVELERGEARVCEAEERLKLGKSETGNEVSDDRRTTCSRLV